MRRRTWLDALRGLAALSVVVAHGSQLFVGLESLAPFVLGSVAVNVFFVVNGFVVPFSLSQAEASWRFAVRRMCRLFPLYLCCLAAAVILRSLGLLPVSAFVPRITMHRLVTNLTMLQWFFDSRSIISVAWTLSYEVVFYALLIALLLLRLYRRTSLMSLVLIGSVFAQIGVSRVAPDVGKAWGSLLSMPGIMAIMWCGTIASRVVKGDIDRRRARLQVVALMSADVVSLLVQHQASYEMLSLIGAILAVSYLCRVHWQPAPALLQWLGRISYSVYLIHGMVITCIPSLPNPRLSIMVWLLVLLPLATATERWIERPGIALGRRLTRHTSLSAPGSPTAFLQAPLYDLGVRSQKIVEHPGDI